MAVVLRRGVAGELRGAGRGGIVGGLQGFDNALDDNVKFVFDLTNVAPFKRVFTDMVIVDDHLSAAEDEKRNSDAWRNFVPNDGMFSEFVPLALGWYGEFGREFKNFVRRIADHYIGDAYAKEWRGAPDFGAGSSKTPQSDRCLFAKRARRVRSGRRGKEVQPRIAEAYSERSSAGH